MNQTANYQFTIVVPVYNEQDNIKRLELELAKFIGSTTYR